MSIHLRSEDFDQSAAWSRARSSWPRRAILLVAVFTCLLLVACDNVSGGKAIQPPLVNKALNHVPVVVTPHFGSPEYVRGHCEPGQLACGWHTERDGTRYSDIYAVEPDDFNDFNRTETVGHECWEAFGARHKKP